MVQILFALVGLVASAQTLPESLRTELFSRVEMLDRMGFPADQIVRRVGMEISGDAPAEIMAFGPTPERAVRAYLRVGLARRQKHWAKMTENRFRACFDQNVAYRPFQVAMAQFLAQPAPRFTVDALVAALPMDVAEFRECLNEAQTVGETLSANGLRTRGELYWIIRDDTTRALDARDAEYARSPVRRTLRRTSEAALGVYHSLTGTVPDFGGSAVAAPLSEK